MTSFVEGGFIEYVQYLKYVSMSGNYLICKSIDGTVTNIRVSKPYLLRTESYSGKTISGVTYSTNTDTTRDADDGTNTWTETIYISYVADDIITVAPMPLNLYGDADTATLQEIANNRIWLRECS